MRYFLPTFSDPLRHKIFGYHGTTYHLKLRTGKATDFKFSGYICRVHLNKSPLKLLREKGAWAYPGAAQIFEYTPYYLSNWQIKLRTSSFVRTYRYIRSIATKAH